MSFGRFVIILVAVLIMAQPVGAAAKSNLRIMPLDGASVLFDGQENSQFKSEAPLSENQVVRCMGNCLVQADGFQLMAHDGSGFSVSESEDGWDLNIKSGSIDFAARPGTKPFAFRNGNNFALVEKVQFPSGGALLKGNVSVTDRGLQISIVKGGLSLVADNRVQPVAAGESVLISDGRMNLLTAEALAAAGAGAGASAGIAGAGSALPIAAGAALLGGVAAAGGISVANDPITPMRKPVSAY